MQKPTFFLEGFLFTASNILLLFHYTQTYYVFDSQCLSDEMLPEHSKNELYLRFALCIILNNLFLINKIISISNAIPTIAETSYPNDMPLSPIYQIFLSIINNAFSYASAKIKAINTV